MMILALLSLFAVQFGSEPEALHFDGRCSYPPALAERAGEVALITCNAVDVDESGIDFVDRQWGINARFQGEWTGRQLEVSSIQLRGNRGPIAAQGQCQIYETNEEVSVIACTGMSRGRNWAANFVRSRINPTIDEW